MDQPRTQLSTLSYLFVGVLIIAAIIGGSKIAILVPLLLLPPALLAWLLYWRRMRQELPLDLLVRMFAAGYIPGALLAGIAEVVLVIIYVFAIYGDEVKAYLEQLQKNQAAGSDDLPDFKPPGLFGFTVFMLFMAYLVAGLVEESMKLLVARWRCCGSPMDCCHPPPDPVDRSPPSMAVYARSTLALMLAAATGFSTVETLMYAHGASEDLKEVLGVAALRTVTSLPLHSVCAAFTALNIVKDKLIDRPSFLRWLWCLRTGVAIHGTFDFVLFMAPMVATPESDTTVSIVSLAIVCTLMAVSLVTCYRQWKALLASFALLPLATIVPAPAAEGIELAEVRIGVQQSSTVLPVEFTVAEGGDYRLLHEQ